VDSALRGLVSPYGVLTAPRRLHAAPGEPRALMWGWDTVAGVSLTDSEEALLNALAGGLARYSMRMFPAVVTGWSFTHGRTVEVPAGDSGGFAVGRDLAAACCDALADCLARDALAVLRPSPRLVVDVTDDAISAGLEAHEKSLVGEPMLFDATDELGIPTVYAVSHSPHNQRTAAVVACATDLTPARAVEKALRDVVAVRTDAALTWEPDPVRCSGNRKLSELVDLSSGDSRTDLRFMVDRLRKHDIEVLAVEVTPDEARDIGFHAVRILAG
jgi:ribosomal protein S12 methylthiotransferase accessory factor YcaO